MSRPTCESKLLSALLRYGPLSRSALWRKSATDSMTENNWVQAIFRRVQSNRHIEAVDTGSPENRDSLFKITAEGTRYLEVVLGVDASISISPYGVAESRIAFEGQLSARQWAPARGGSQDFKSVRSIGLG